IGILLEDRIIFIEVMIGILKAGCAFVPLDTAYPRERLQKMSQAAGLELIVTDNCHLDSFQWESSGISSGLPVEFILLEELFQPGGREELQRNAVDGGSPGYPKRPGIVYNRENKIYIYFTSGTTGLPSAIVGKNSSLVHFINWEIERFEIDETTRLGQLTTPGFDAFLRDVFVPLCAGGVICIPGSKETLLNSLELSQWVENTR
ncbi:MAG: AMP-binding protein, partial [bacterium]|nr:AMP-binding protein [bacterium]